MPRPITPPRGWGDDPLTSYLEQSHQNRLATFANKREQVDRLISIDRCFVIISEGWLNPKKIVQPMLFLRSHAAFRSACEHALATQVVETFPLVRTCLEYAAYALFIDNEPNAAEIWLNRHNSAEARQAVVKAFQVGPLRKAIEKRNRKAAEVFTLLYDRAIDHGGHPNERAVTSSLQIKEHPDRREFVQQYLHGDGPQLDFALKTVAQAGVCALEILQEIFAARFELLGVRASLLDLRRGL